MARPGPGERMPADERFRQAELAAERPHLVLEEHAERLDQAHVHALRQPADIVVRLDGDRRPAGEGDATRSRRDRACPARGTRRRRASSPPPRTSRRRAGRSSSASPPGRRRRRARRGRRRTRPRGRAGCCSGRGRARTTSSASFSRIRPWSTKMQVSWSPIASWISTAATAESTPPESPQITLPRPTCSRMRAIASSLNCAIVQSPAGRRSCARSSR